MLMVAVMGGVLVLAAGCATVGRDFSTSGVAAIRIGETTKTDARALFGNPWRTGVEDGRETWTYGHYRYSLFSPAQTRDLVLRFDKEGRVASYTFNSTHPEDARR
ncbi:outer membrane protein assembly factor BamE domain-containing protein [Geoalkalibacter sp.]|uniref:outer membrane protein assembly factor BamE domain-containing protein n=1 Tax=Geoalkalibacter sp. TaxID=3041440 RepID=UPI00272DD0E9|nr:outer membrane protein assembly factor BamE [Geoalkalibacter sp.]